ncbi:MAG TPA: hypothetical protein VHF50_01900 [Solirubrobacterales bacterium]|nr:hypothetical protein [Solirubrobacterales bacterium]
MALAVVAGAAQAASPLKIREVHPGTVLAPASEYVELQMTADGQGDVDGQVLRFYDATGAEVSSFTIPTDVANGSSQRSVLLATAAAGVSADFTLPAGDRISPLGGAVCFTGAVPADCVAWGTFATPAVLPNPQSGVADPIGNELALTRRITAGCSTYLDSPDDSDNSDTDFEAVAPTPRNNSATPTEQRCPPDTAINTAPANPTNDPSAAFSFAELPDEPGATFECELDGNGSFATAVACDSGSIAYPGPLSDGLHTFRVRAEGEGGVDATPDSYTWTVDTVAPETSIASRPPDPNSGFSVSFTYTSSESQSGFRCQLDSGAIQVCSASGKTYFDLTDGSHTFRVWAIDNAGNKDESAAEDSFTVQKVLGDLTPPDTSIVAGPPSSSPSSDASFRYASSERGSRFECRLGSAAFSACDAGGISYRDLRNGSYSFEVRATDAAGNVDSVPAAYSWRVAAPLPNSRIAKGPAGRVVLRKGRRAKVKFVFASDKPGSTFRCRLDKARLKPCARTKTVRARPGRHRLEVYAVDSLGNEETTPARRIFRVVKRGGGGFFSTSSPRRGQRR